MRFQYFILSLFLIATAASCRSKKLKLKNEYTVLSTGVVEGANGILSGYVFYRENNKVVPNARINLVRPPFEKLYSVELSENGYFEIPLPEGKYDWKIEQGNKVLLEEQSFKIKSGIKTELLVYLKNE